MLLQFALKKNRCWIKQQFKWKLNIKVSNIRGMNKQLAYEAHD